MALNKDDTFPLWSFVYASTPMHDKPDKVMTSRGRTWQEAWNCIQKIGRSFLEPEKVGLCGVVCISHKKDYDRTHPYNWLHDAPLWLKMQEGAHEQIWEISPTH